MEHNQYTFVFGDNWWVEEDKAWFVEAVNNILIGVNMNTGECVEAVRIPEAANDTYRLTPFCMKSGREIFCIPGRGKNMWVYHLDNGEFSKIEIQKPEDTQLGIGFWRFRDTIFVILGQWNKIIEIDAGQNRIEKYYTICEERIIKSAMTDSCIYMSSSKPDRIYQFDCVTKAVSTHTLPDNEKKIFTICFDGKKFWMSGYRKEIYIWNQGDYSLTVLDNFPEGFGIYDYTSATSGRVDCSTAEYELPTFVHAQMVGEYIWFIPGQTNMILYADKENGELYSFDIAEENETRESLLAGGRLACKYVWQYVRDDRYIGLFSTKNNCVMEIDTKELKYQRKKYAFGNQCIRKCDEIFKEVYFEGNALHNAIYRTKLQALRDVAEDLKADSVGEDIYKRLGELCDE